MSDWWMSRTLREKLLLSAAAALLAGALWYQFLLQPLLTQRAEARQDHERAVQTLVRLDRIARLKAEGAPLRPAAATGDVETLRRNAIQRAGNAGLTVTDSRLSATGTFQADIARADPAVFFAWVRALETEEGLIVIASSLLPSEGGLVSISVEFSTGPAQ